MTEMAIRVWCRGCSTISISCHQWPSRTLPQARQCCPWTSWRRGQRSEVRWTYWTRRDGNRWAGRWRWLPGYENPSQVSPRHPTHSHSHTPTLHRERHGGERGAVAGIPRGHSSNIIKTDAPPIPCWLHPLRKPLPSLTNEGGEHDQCRGSQGGVKGQPNYIATHVVMFTGGI